MDGGKGIMIQEILFNSLSCHTLYVILSMFSTSNSSSIRMRLIFPLSYGCSHDLYAMDHQDGRKPPECPAI